MTRIVGLFAVCRLIGGMVLPVAAAAQQATITGTVRDSLTRHELAGARVFLQTHTGKVIAGGEADIRGRFRLTGPADDYTLAVRAVGYEPLVLTGIRLAEGGANRIDVLMRPIPLTMQTVQVVAKHPERHLTAPAAVTMVPSAAITERPAVVLSDHLRDVPGIDLASKGIGKATYSGRGPAAATSAALLVLQDHREASLPALRLNVPYFIPATSDDIDRIEIARGPASAVYGPNADRGVVHIITRSPFESQGASVTLAGGNRSTRMVSARAAGRLGPGVAGKISAEYFAADDWKFDDPREVVPRDSRVERAGGEARVDWRIDPRSTLILAGGLSQAMSNVELTSVGSTQVRDWSYRFLQARFARERLFAHLFYNVSDAGESIQLYTGEPLVDHSRALTAQLHNGSRLGSRTELTYGGDLQRVDPRTDGTINGRYEDRDATTLAGAFLNADVTLSQRWSLIAAARGDHHNQLDDFVISPRVGLVFQPARDQALRLTWNHGTSTPVSVDLFLDFTAGTLAPLAPYDINARGSVEGLTFRRDCNGGLCMRSPFVGDPRAFLPLDGTVAWPAIVALLQQQGIDLSGIPAPTAGDVHTVLARLNPATERFETFSGEVTDVPAAERTRNSTIEAGYRGLFRNRWSVSVDVYTSRISNLLTAARVQTPQAFLDSLTLGTYLTGYLSEPQARAIAGAVGQLPVGTMSPIQADSTEIMVVARQEARVRFWGADLAVSAPVGRYLTVSGSWSWTSKDVVQSSAGYAVNFNAPKHKGSLALGLVHPSGLSADLRGRAVKGFPVSAGVYQGEVDSYLLLDAGVNYRLPWNPAIAVGLSATNLLNHRHQEFVGAPEIGRLVLLRARAAF